MLRFQLICFDAFFAGFNNYLEKIDCMNEYLSVAYLFSSLSFTLSLNGTIYFKISILN